MNSWTQSINIFDVQFAEKDDGAVIVAKSGDTDVNVYIKKAMVDSEEPEDIVNWLNNENFNDFDVIINTNGDKNDLVFKFYDINDAIRFRTSFGVWVQVVKES